ncbi:kinetochore-associated Ndc80 complex subunit spc24 [Dinochytrium kinnereticum]|nr:kinetochore-associated Ndc80 complex subunit spc24 [Dinochytrium kinnereticum]
MVQEFNSLTGRQGSFQTPSGPVSDKFRTFVIRQPTPKMMGATQQQYDDDNDPHSVLSTILAHMDPSQELATISEIRKALMATEKHRMKNSNDAIELLRSLSREIDNVKKETQKTNRPLAEAEHRNRIAALDSKKFSTAKEIQDIHEIEQKRQLSKALMELKARENEEYGRAPGENAYKVEIFRQLGVTAIDDGNGQYKKFIVSSLQRNDVEEVEINDSTYSNFYYANVLWDLCSN